MTLLLVFVNDIFWKGKKFSCLYYFHTFLLSMYFRPCQTQLFLCGKYLFVFFYMVPVFLFLAYIPFTGFLWFPLESFSSFLKKPYYSFSRTLVGTEPAQAFHDGTILISPSLVKDALSGHRSVLGRFLLHAKVSFHCLLAPIASAEMSAVGDSVPPFSLPLPGRFSSPLGLSSSLVMHQGVLLSLLPGMHVVSCTCDLSLRPGWGNSRHPLASLSLTPPLPRLHLHD